LEPKIFLTRDYHFYDKIYFPISHKYIKQNVLEENIKDIFFCPHRYNFKDIKENNKKFLFCELVTTQHVYFGKIYFTNSYIFFETEKFDPSEFVKKDESDSEYDSSTKYLLSIINKVNETSKYKSFLILTKDIQEIIQRRTLLANQSIEIMHKNGKTYFFNFYRTKELEKVYNYIEDINKYLLI
jgi:hypothetical protein